MQKREAGLFPALIKHWRTRRGLSQLDLALAADVSSRHVSFLETGRAQPSREMILRLAGALNVPLRDQNALLLAAGHPQAFEEPAPTDALPGPIAFVIERMLAQHEPFPMTVLNRRYDVLQANHGARIVLGRMVLDPSAISTSLNAFDLLFDPRLSRPFIVDWERVARTLLSRLHREALERRDADLTNLARRLLEFEEVPKDWHAPDFSVPNEPCLAIRLRRDDLELAFLTTVTAFSAPQNVAIEDMRIESYFPLNDATARACEALVREAN